MLFFHAFTSEDYFHVALVHTCPTSISPTVPMNRSSAEHRCIMCLPGFNSIGRAYPPCNLCSSSQAITLKGKYRMEGRLGKAGELGALVTFVFRTGRL